MIDPPWGHDCVCCMELLKVNYHSNSKFASFGVGFNFPTFVLDPAPLPCGVLEVSGASAGSVGLETPSGPSTPVSLPQRENCVGCSTFTAVGRSIFC